MLRIAPRGKFLLAETHPHYCDSMQQYVVTSSANSTSAFQSNKILPYHRSTSHHQSTLCHQSMPHHRSNKILPRHQSIPYYSLFGSSYDFGTFTPTFLLHLHILFAKRIQLPLISSLHPLHSWLVDPIVCCEFTESITR